MNTNLTQITYLLWLAIPIGCVSWTVTNEEIFRDLREICITNCKCPKRSYFFRKLCYLPTCHYCFSHYVSAIFIALTGCKFLMSDWRGYIIAEFTLVLIANVYLSLYNILRLGVRKLRVQCEYDEARVRKLNG